MISPGDLVLIYDAYRTTPVYSPTSWPIQYVTFHERKSMSGLVLAVTPSPRGDLFNKDLTILFDNGEIGYALDSDNWVQKRTE